MRGILSPRTLPVAPPTALPWRHQTLAYSAAPDRYALYPALPQLRPRSQAPSRLTTTDMRCLLDHARTRYNTLAWGGSHWPVLPRPRLAGFQVSTEAPGGRSIKRAARTPRSF